jgi:hypothetical protein
MDAIKTVSSYLPPANAILIKADHGRSPLTSQAWFTSDRCLKIFRSHVDYGGEMSEAEGGGGGGRPLKHMKLGYIAENRALAFTHSARFLRLSMRAPIDFLLDWVLSIYICMCRTPKHINTAYFITRAQTLQSLHKQKTAHIGRHFTTRTGTERQTARQQ